MFVFMELLGMPYPQNLETAKEIEAIVRDNGAIPATIAILEGVPHIGVYCPLFLHSSLWKGVHVLYWM